MPFSENPLTPDEGVPSDVCIFLVAWGRLVGCCFFDLKRNAIFAEWTELKIQRQFVGFGAAAQVQEGIRWLEVAQRSQDRSLGSDRCITVSLAGIATSTEARLTGINWIVNRVQLQCLIQQEKQISKK